MSRLPSRQHFQKSLTFQSIIIKKKKKKQVSMISKPNNYQKSVDLTKNSRYLLCKLNEHKFSKELSIF